LINKIGKTDSELTVEKIQSCRDIVSEIMNFGVSQAQIKTIIKFLALELEDRAVMTRITASLSGEDLRINKNEDSQEEIVAPARKIIT
jgi:hypothetical protein